jgi:hypothetical protein
VYDFFVREMALGEAAPMGMSGTGTDTGTGTGGGSSSSSSNKRARTSPHATKINEAK